MQIQLVLHRFTQVSVHSERFEVTPSDSCQCMNIHGDSMKLTHFDQNSAMLIEIQRVLLRIMYIHRGSCKLSEIHVDSVCHTEIETDSLRLSQTDED